MFLFDDLAVWILAADCNLVLLADERPSNGEGLLLLFSIE